MRCLSTATHHERGAVAIMFVLSMFVLFGFMALAIDLGRTYVVRTELQNAADAAALAGAKELNQTLSGVQNAVDKATQMAAQNNFKFSTSVTITSANMSVGSCPGDACMVPVSSVTSDALAAGRTFLKVDIPSGVLATFFAVVPTTAAGTGTPSTNTFGRAVAGRFVNDITPIGICAIDLNKGGTRPTTPPGADDELTQFGFRRGVSYNVFELGPLGTSSDPYLLDPIDVYPNPCISGNSSAAATAPFICNGAFAGQVTAPGTVWGNSGVSASKIEASLNSRFNDFTSPSVCIPSQAPPDVNVRIYPCTTGANCVSSPTGMPNTWMDPTNTTTPNSRQTFNLAGITSMDDYGVLWSYSRAVKAVGASPNATPGLPFTPADWPSLYPIPALNAETSYPGGLAGTTGSPYSQPSGSSYFLAPTTNPGTAKRRVLNLAIANCPAVTGSGGCQVVPILGIGRFFMQVPADFSGGTKKLQVEFAGLVEPITTADIKLYR